MLTRSIFHHATAIFIEVMKKSQRMRLILCLPVQKGSWKLIFSQAENYLISYNISYNLQKRDTHNIGNVFCLLLLEQDIVHFFCITIVFIFFSVIISITNTRFYLLNQSEIFTGTVFFFCTKKIFHTMKISKALFS